MPNLKEKMMSEKENPLIHETVSPGFERSISYLDNLMVVVCDFTNGPAKKPDPPHSHPHEQITYVAEGELIFFKNGKGTHMSKGDIVSIPSGIPHSIQTLSKHVVLIDSFSPNRKDFLKK
jgi:quercetin dioxygenase-like cupin family protein